MEHKTLINGEYFDILGGKTLIDGANFNIVSGKTLAFGEMYDIFVEKVIITLTGTGRGTLATAIIDGTQYSTGQDEVIKVPINTIITLNVKDNSNYGDEGNLNLVDKNGKVYYSTNSEGNVPYQYTVMGNITINFSYGSVIDYMAPAYHGLLTVYEE